MEIHLLELLCAIDFLLAGLALEWNLIIFATVIKPNPQKDDVESVKRMINELSQQRQLNYLRKPFSVILTAWNKN